MFLIINNIIKGFPALCFLIWAILMPKVGGYAFVAVYVAFQAYLFVIDAAKPNPDQSRWFADEITILREYHLALRFPFGARIMSQALNGFRWIGLLFLSPWLLWNHMWIAVVVVIISFFVTGPISVRLDPFFFLSDAVNRGGRTQFASELALLKQVSERLRQRQHFRIARDCYQTGKYRDAILYAKESIALLKSLPYDVDKFMRQRDDLVEMVRVCVGSLRKLDRPQEGLVECDRAIGYFNEFVERIQDLREHGSDLDEEELDKLEELAICQALGLSQFLSAIKKETGAELPPDYDPGFRIQRT